MLRCAASPRFSRLLTEFRFGFRFLCSSLALLSSFSLVDSLGRSAGFDAGSITNHSERLHMDEKSATRSFGSGLGQLIIERVARFQVSRWRGVPAKLDQIGTVAARNTGRRSCKTCSIRSAAFFTPSVRLISSINRRT